LTVFRKGGTCCPTCGTRQAHTHLGWLRLGEVLFTQLNCKKCGHTSLIVRFVKEQNKAVYQGLDEAIRGVFEREASK